MALNFIKPIFGLALLALSFTNSPAFAEANRVTLPDISQLEHFSTVRRGEITEHMMTTREAIGAVKRGEPMPDGTHVVLVDYRSGEIYRYFVMQKGGDWGQDYAEADRTGDWQFQWFWGNGQINMDENTQRCRSCHASQADNRYMFTYDDLLDFE
ncbi:cytochrome P460 family protein [uncultured Cohaesibacter sp.]|uniref:cytochrome P460 family protein n=1 Tax=uncultured Cohaesibacter sp. TaxID=1002546 RepID=UPI00292F64CF|nr:cytochrome P460 family protein [uncultured Cohaesibacter sp.]